MSYQVLARKWRPATFGQMVGQEHVLQALVNALDSDRLHHAYLFSGTRGVGKTTIARIFAKSLNCERGVGSEPCGECSSCREIDEGRSVDLIEIDAASRTGVDDMRELLDNVQYAPTRGRFKVYLIDEVHMLSKHSFNALLKTLEEPPPHIKFLLATTDPQKVPVTVLSRCLQFNLKRMSRSQIMSQLQFLTEQEQLESETAALTLLSRAADGSMRDALSLLDQAIAHGAGAVLQSTVESMLGAISREYLIKLFDALIQQDAVDLLRESRAIIDNNPDYQRVCGEMISMLQQIAIYQQAPALALDADLGESLLQHYAAQWSADEVQLYYQILLQGRQDLLICPEESAGFEMLMLRLLAFAPPGGQSDSQPGQKKKRVIPPPTEASAGAEAAPGSESAAAVPAQTTAATCIPSGTAPAAVSTTAPASRQGGGAAPAELSPEPNSLADSTRRRGPDARSGAECSAAEIVWSALAYELGLEGLALQIAANSVLTSQRGDHLELQLLAEIHVLANPTIEDEITQALKRKLGVSFSLELVSSSALVDDTPLQCRQKNQQQERLAAIEAIRQENVVKKLQQAFSAELDEASVVKIDNQASGE